MQFLIVFHDFLARSLGDPRGAGESPDPEKMGFVRFGAAQEGFMSNILFEIKSLDFLILIDSLGFHGVPGDTRGSRGSPGTPGDPQRPIFNRFLKEK